MAIDFQPYVGPRPYERDDVDIFFGRNREAEELVSLIVSSKEVLFYAQSGTGKTSLLNARVIPQLIEDEGFEVLPLARVQGMIPKGTQPEEIQNLYVFNTLMCWAKQETNPERFVRMSLLEYLNERQHRIDSEEQPVPRALIFDQFEEIFTLYQDRWNDRNDFFQQVRDALKAENRLLRVIFTIREDYIAQLDPYAHLLPEKLRTRFRMERLRMDAALSAVTGPLKGTHLSFTKGVAEKLVEDLLKTRVETITGETIEVIGEFVEPVQLQVVCQSLWQELPPDVTEITEQHVLALGGVDRPLSGFYENAVKEAAAEARIEEKELRQWCEKWLITSNGTRNIVHRGTQFTEELPTTALDSLVAHRLLNLELRAGSYWYELTHDSFIEPIRTSNVRWREEKVYQVSLMISQAEQSITLGKYERALDASRNAFDLCEEVGDLQGQANALNYLARAYTEQKNYDAALTTYAKALDIVKQTDARQLEAYLLGSQGNIFEQTKEYKQALQCFTGYIDILPDDSLGYYNRGVINFDLNQYQLAITDYTRALELDPKYIDAYNNRGRAYYNLKRYDQALDDYNHALKLDPKYTYAYINRGLAYSALKRYDQALDDSNHALELDPNYCAAYLTRGYAYLWLRDIKQAHKDFMRIWQLDSANVNYGWMAEWTTMCQEKPDLQIAERLEAIAANAPDDIVAFICRGVALWIRKHDEEAIAELNQAFSLNSESEDIFFWKGIVLAYLGQDEEAIAAIEKSLELELPPLLLSPMRWIEQDRPDFYRKYAAPLLARYEI